MAMFMYASCAWFFEDVARVETAYALRHAARAIQLTRENGGLNLEPGFLTRLAAAKGNQPEKGDAAAVYRGTLP
jgi:hypothetical protein